MSQQVPVPAKPTPAFVGASWLCLIIGISAYNILLWNSAMELNERGYYFTILMFGLFAGVSLQKSVRDRAENIPVTGVYLGIAWFSLALSLLLLTVGLWNLDADAANKGFYAIAFCMTLFAAIAVQKNVRDQLAAQRGEAAVWAENTALFGNTQSDEVAFPAPSSDNFGAHQGQLP